MSDLPLFVGDDIRELADARCYNPTADDTKLHPDAWTPDGSTEMQPGRTGWIAVRECRKCDVRLECLLQAIDRDEQHGIWGGFWFGESSQKKRAINAAKLKRKAA